MIILRGPDRYYIIYRGKSNIVTHAEYSPPRDGGPFSMPEVCLSEYPVLGEIAYVRTITVQMLIALNDHKRPLRQTEIALSGIDNELDMM